MADLRIVDAPVLLQESITDDVKMPTGGLGNFSIRLGDIVWYVVQKEQLANKNYVDLSSKGVKDSLDVHIADKANPHKVTKSQLGLSNVDNTADIDKPVSNAVNSAIITATNDMATKTYVNQKDNLKADKATTLSGYGIANAYTKSEINTNYGGVKTLYEKNVEAGAGANGWTTALVTENGLTQKQINEKQKIKNLENVSVKDFDAKGDGVTSDVAAINAMANNFNRVHFSDGTYLIDSTLTIKKPVSFSPNAKIKLANNAKVYFAAGTCDKICAHWFGSVNPIQDAVISARDVKCVYVRSGIWLIDTPIVIPSEVAYWGITIEGSSDSQQYEVLRSSSSTIIKANKAMNVVIGNRLDWRDDSGYYNKVKNLTIDGNNLAKYGYINGYQDTLKGVNAIFCQTAGIIFGRLSNSTRLSNVSSARNGNGIILTGLPPDGASTHALIDNCRFRQNTEAGVVFAQAIGVKFTDCVIESNTVFGIKVKKATTSDDFYAGESAFVAQIYFDRCGMENNGQLLELDGTGLGLSFIEFARCNLVGKTTDKLNPVVDIYTKSVRGLIFDYCAMLKIGYKADAETYAVKINAFNTLDNSYPTVFGVSSANVVINKLLDSGDMFSDHIALGLNAQTQKIVTTSRTLSKSDVANTVLINSAQGDVDLTLTLPMGLVSSPQYSYTFTFVATTQKLAQKLTFNTQSGAYIIYNGAVRTALDTAGNGIGLGTAIKFTLVVHQGVQYWLAENITGSWRGS